MEINVINRGKDFGLLTQTAAVPRLLAHRMALAEYIVAAPGGQLSWPSQPCDTRALELAPKNQH
jgi:hypothetical protein